MLTKLSKYIFLFFIGYYLISKSFYQYFVFDMLVHYSVYALIIALIFAILYNYLIRKQKNKSILYILPIFIIPFVVYNEIGYYYLGENAKSEKENLKIISINIFSQNNEYQHLESYITEEHADVIVLQELTPDWQKNIEFIREKYPHYKEEPRTNNFGIAVYSKIPFDTIITRNYIDNMHPSLIGELNVNGKTVSILMTHPVPPLPNQARFERRNKQYKLMKDEIDNMRNENIIFIGDFNSTTYSPNFKLLQSDKLKDARSGFGLQNSWNAFIPILRTNIDQCWVSKNIKVTNFFRGKDIQSDHFPIVVELKIE